MDILDSVEWVYRDMWGWRYQIKDQVPEIERLGIP